MLINASVLSPRIVQEAIAQAKSVDAVKAIISPEQASEWERVGIAVYEFPPLGTFRQGTIEGGDLGIGTGCPRTLGGMRLEIDLIVPKDSIHFLDKDRNVVGRIIGLDIPQEKSA